MTQTTFIDHFVKSHDGLQLYCREYGRQHQRPGAVTVLCLPGLTRNSRDFYRLGISLSSTHRVLTPDFRGRGRSAYDPIWQNYQPATYAQDVITTAQLLQADRLFIIGTSLGGLVTMVVAAMRPRLLAGVVLNDIGPDVDPAGLQRIASYVGKLPPVSSWAEAAAQAKRVNGHALPDLSDDDWMHFAQCTYRNNANGRPLPDMDPGIAEALRVAPTGPVDLWPLFEALAKVPTLLIRGGHSDILSQATLEDMRAVKPDLRVLVVPGRGHAPTLDEPLCRSAIRSLLNDLPAA